MPLYAKGLVERALVMYIICCSIFLANYKGVPMKFLTRMMMVAVCLTSLSAFAGTINAGIYFPKDCLTQLKYKPMPQRLLFTCDQDGNCFANDMQLNALLNCAKPFGDKQFNSQTVQSYYLTRKGFIKK